MTTHDKSKQPEEENSTSPQEFEKNILPIEGEQLISGDKTPEKTEENSKKDEMVTIPLKEYADQMQKIDELQNKVNETTDGWQRERADFSNYRNRINRDQQQAKEDLVAEVIKKYLAVNDDIERALKNTPSNKEVNHWVEGIRLINQKLQNILKTEGVKRIPAEDEYFDPHRHEAISMEESSQTESGRIIEVIQQGYTIGDRVIRPAQVRVAK